MIIITNTNIPIFSQDGLLTILKIASFWHVCLRSCVSVPNWSISGHSDKNMLRTSIYPSRVFPEETIAQRSLSHSFFSSICIAYRPQTAQLILLMNIWKPYQYLDSVRIKLRTLTPSMPGSGRSTRSLFAPVLLYILIIYVNIYEYVFILSFEIFWHMYIPYLTKVSAPTYLYTQYSYTHIIPHTCDYGNNNNNNNTSS